MNTGGLNCPWALTHVQSRDMSAPLTAAIRHSPGGLLSAGGSVCEGGDSCFVSQEKLKPGVLKEIPEKMKLFSDFLAKRPWFAGDKVSGMASEEGELVLFLTQSSVRIHALSFCSSPMWISWLMMSLTGTAYLNPHVWMNFQT